MSLRFLLDYLPVLNILVLPALGWLIRALRRDLATREDLQSHARSQGERLSSLTQRVALVERDLQHLPDSADFESLRKWMTTMAMTASGHQKQLESLTASMSRIEDHLLNKRGGGSQ